MKLLNKFSKWRTPGKLLLLLLLALLLVGGPALASSGGSFDLSWWTVDGGGGTSNGGSYALSGTVGQADASEPLSGGSYALTGGFWAGPGGGDWSTDVVITGPIVGEVGTTYAFTATVAPITTTTPITYSWVVDDQAPVVNVVGGVQDAIDLSWADGGTHTITVTIDNGVGTVTSVDHIITLKYMTFLPMIAKP